MSCGRMKVMIWVNFKIYKQSFGDGAIRLAGICQKVVDETKVKIIPVVSAFDLFRVKKEFNGEVWVQHLDNFFEGKKTGWLSPLQAVALGANGTLLNHSERKLSPGQIRQFLAYLKREKWVKHWAKEMKSVNEKWSTRNEKFKVMVCFHSKGQVKKWLSKLNPPPDFVAYEPVGLIGSKTSVSEAQPQMIKNIVELLPKHRVIVGAGIHKMADVKKALSLGVKGVLVSSDVVKAKNAYKELKELALAF